MRMSRAWVWLVFLPSTAYGAAFYVPDLGVRALGRGGAFVARADDLTAAWYNPAGLADQGGTRFIADMGFIKQSVNYQRTDETGTPIGPPIGNTAFPFTIPFLGISSDFGLKNLTFSLSAYGPYSSKYSYPENGSQRYTLIESGVLEALYQVSVGWRITPWLKVGASIQNVDVGARQKLALAVLPTTPATEGQSDVRVNFDVNDHLTPNAHFGLLVSPASFLEFGASVKPPMPVNAEGTLDINQDDIARLRAKGGLLANLAVQGNQVGLKFDLPLVVRSGLRFKHPRFDIETDFVVERWGGFSRLEVVPKDITYNLTGTPQKLTPIVQDRGYGDAYSIRVGSDIEIIPGKLTARVGYYYETSAVPDQSLNVSSVDTEKHGFTVGVSAKFGWFGISAAYAYVTLAEKYLLKSTSTQINLADIAFGAQAPVVANGRYRSGYDMLAVGFSIDIDTVAGWKRRE
jgi:long-chain fatty acid transport protein